MNGEKSAVTTAYETMRQKARAAWQELKEQPLILVGTATCGRAAGALLVLEKIRAELEQRQLAATVMEVGCMGHCYAEPLVVISKPGFPSVCYGYVDEGIAGRLVQDFIGDDDLCIEYALAAVEVNDMIPTFGDFPRGVTEHMVVLKDCGMIDPEQFDHYLAMDGYAGLASALAMNPAQVVEQVKEAGLRGRGGAGFSTGTKWEICRGQQEQTRYVICNADEGDPGAFMDRTILESNPHLMLEGLAIAAYAVGAQQGYVYIRAEYPLAVQRVELAISQARQAGLLGKSILGSGFDFEVKIFQGSGAFVCGEETALIASMEGEPGMPRHRPPFPAGAGLWGKPTVINNVKTLSYVPYIISKGKDWFLNIGTPGNPGTAIFALAGKIINTGLVEVPMGTTLNQVIYDVGSGVGKGKHFKAVQIGGPSGGCLPESVLDTPIDFDSLNKAGAMMGSGGMVVMDQDDCMVEIARYFLDFTQQESCGKCTFCRLGTRHMLDILERITKGQGKLEDLDLLLELAEDIKLGSLCNLGKTVPNPILSTMRYFRDEYEAHINEKRCPSLMCKDLIAYYIIPEKCERGCEACVTICTVEAIYSDDNKLKIIDQSKCVKCDACVAACPPEYDAVIKLSPPELVEQRGRGVK